MWGGQGSGGSVAGAVHMGRVVGWPPRVPPDGQPHTRHRCVCVCVDTARLACAVRGTGGQPAWRVRRVRWRCAVRLCVGCVVRDDVLRGALRVLHGGRPHTRHRCVCVCVWTLLSLPVRCAARWALCVRVCSGVTVRGRGVLWLQSGAAQGGRGRLRTRRWWVCVCVCALLALAVRCAARCGR